jgi:hypothetical protein
VTQTLELWPVNARKNAGADYYTHLTINFGRDAEIDDGTNYDRKAAQTRNGIDLPKADSV